MEQRAFSIPSVGYELKAYLTSNDLEPSFSSNTTTEAVAVLATIATHYGANAEFLPCDAYAYSDYAQRDSFVSHVRFNRLSFFVVFVKFSCSEF